ncbi:MAG: hypothetical protein ACR5LG_14050 [Sodalis sp. (in: enterobacteria)]|uniref:hypothetical protein n=1 Tax=Sodalis sp. (in: enterobacteria) TaxID=1898979 RepID=UPI003F3391FF
MPNRHCNHCWPDNRARRIAVRVSRPAQGALRLHIDVVAANGNLQTFTRPIKVI